MVVSENVLTLIFMEAPDSHQLTSHQLQTCAQVNGKLGKPVSLELQLFNKISWCLCNCDHLIFTMTIAAQHKLFHLGLLTSPVLWTLPANTVGVASAYQVQLPPLGSFWAIKVVSCDDFTQWKQSVPILCSKWASLAPNYMPNYLGTCKILSWQRAQLMDCVSQPRRQPKSQVCSSHVRQDIGNMANMRGQKCPWLRRHIKCREAVDSCY